MIENFVIIDLEWNTCRLGGDKFLNEIIEIGAVKLNKKLEITDTFQAFVKPTFGEQLTSTVKKLTRITNEDLVDVPTFKKAYKMFSKWAEGTEVLLSFGNSDILVMLENFKAHKMPVYIDFIDGYADLQLYCQEKLQLDTANLIGLTPLAECLKINIDDMSMHRALDDCKVSAECFKRLYNEDFKSCINENNSEFYDRIQFKNSYITNLSHDGVKLAEAHLKCPECGCYLKRYDDWFHKNNSLRALMVCGKCKNRYLGRIKLRVEYDGIKVKSSFSSYEKENV